MSRQKIANTIIRYTCKSRGKRQQISTKHDPMMIPLSLQYDAALLFDGQTWGESLPR